MKIKQLKHQSPRLTETLGESVCNPDNAQCGHCGKVDTGDSQEWDQEAAKYSCRKNAFTLCTDYGLLQLLCGEILTVFYCLVKQIIVIMAVSAGKMSGFMHWLLFSKGQ